MDDALITDESDHDDTPPQPAVPRPRTGVMMCGTVVLFVVAIVVGSIGHAAYEATYVTLDRGTFVSGAALVGAVDETANVCTDPWTYLCGKYSKAHTSGSHINDKGTAERRDALDAFTESGSGPAKTLFNRCLTYSLRPDASACDAMYTENYTLSTAWRRGITPNDIAFSRVPNPYIRGVQTVVIWVKTETQNAELYPTSVTCHDDPCDLCTLYRTAVCPDWATALECSAPRFLVYGSIDGLCSRWKYAVRNTSLVLQQAVQDARDECYVTMSRVVSPMGCFLKVAEYYPSVNTPYLMSKHDRYDTNVAIGEWFARVRSVALRLAVPFGQRVLEQIQSISFHTGWHATNRPIPPLQLLDATADIPLALSLIHI